MDITIREAITNDYSDICRIINTSLGYPDVTLPALSERMARMQANGNYFNLVATDGAEIVGFISVSQGIAVEIDGDYFRIIALAVDETHKRRGIGRALLAHMEQIAEIRGIRYFTLSSGFQRTGAHAFYEQNGYEKKSFAFSKGSK